MVAVVSSAQAAVSGTSEITAESRMNRRLGIILGVGSPSPGLFGANVAYNVLSALRAEVGLARLTTSLFGEESSSTTFGFGAKGFMPGWKLTPTVGLHFATFSTTTSSEFFGTSSTTGGSHVYTTLGLDYQAASGFNLGVGYAMSFGGKGSSAFINLGWFFDWLG